MLDGTCIHESRLKLPAEEANINQLLDHFNRRSTKAVLLHSHGLGDEELLVATAQRLQLKPKLAEANR